MTLQQALTPRDPDPKLGQIIKLAVMAVGGQGGGVLTGWIEKMARAQGYAVQATSVAGVAQRTGATIYYVEMAPAADRQPVFSLAPAAGDVDILIAAEMMEAGRAILRGFVTPDRTVLIGSTHRALAVSEKMTPGDGIANPAEVRAAAEIAARKVLFLDMEALARDNGSVISASLFGALAGSGALPFPREAYEDAIRGGGKGVDPSLRAFAAGFAAAEAGETPKVDVPKAAPAGVIAPGPLQAEWAALLARAEGLPAPVVAMARAGLQKTVDFQDIAYGAEYLTRLERLIAQDKGEKEFVFSREAAKYLANAMAYDDVIRVADLKTRGARFARIREEMGVTPDTLMQLTEFMHPRAEEIAGMLPAGLGARVERSARAMRLLDRLFNKGRRLRTDGLWAFCQLYALGGLRRWRRGTLRHHQEKQHTEAWLATAQSHLPQRYDLGVETLRCRRLIKGYSDTHARGQSKFDKVLAGIVLVQAREDAADWARRLREAALQDEEGKALEGALATIRTFIPDR
jgi:indolepyruvate ferredoxin oxidoreductase beta subunit